MEKRDDFASTGTINMENDYEVRYWTSQLKVTNDELKAAVEEVGNLIEAVKVYLHKA